MITNLSKHISDNFPYRSRSHVLHMCIKYLMHSCSAFDFHRSLKKVLPRNYWPAIKKLRMEMKQSGYVLLNYRAFLYETVHDYLVSEDAVSRVEPRGVRLGICSGDARNAIRCGAVTDTSVLEYVRKLTPSELESVIDVLAIQRVYHEFEDNLRKYATNYVGYKLRFISNSCNIEPNDLVSDIILKAVEAHYWTYPSTMTPAHRLNYLRRSCTNTGLNLIYYYTADKRSRLIGNHEGFELKMVSENQISDKEISYDMLECPGEIRNVDLGMSIKSLVSRYSKHPKLAIFLKIVMGQRYNPFEQWLVRYKIIRSFNDSSVYSERHPDEYMNLAAEFLGIQKYVHGMFDRMRLSLAG